MSGRNTEMNWLGGKPGLEQVIDERTQIVAQDEKNRQQDDREQDDDERQFDEAVGRTIGGQPGHQSLNPCLSTEAREIFDSSRIRQHCREDAVNWQVRLLTYAASLFPL